MVQIILRLSGFIILFLISSCTTTVVDFNVAENRRTIYLDLNKDSISEGNFYVDCSYINLTAYGNYNLKGDSLKQIHEFSASIKYLKQDSITYSVYNYTTKQSIDFKTISFAEFKKTILDSIKIDPKHRFSLSLNRFYLGGDTPPKDKLTFNYSISIANEQINTSVELTRTEREVIGATRFH